MLTINRARMGYLQAPFKKFLSTIEIFKNAPAGALQEIEGKMIEKKFTRHESIFLEGDSAEFVWFVKEGHVKAMVNAASGRCQTLCMMGAQNMFGTCCGLSGQYPCHSVAETDVTVVAIPIADFRSFLGKYPGVALALVVHLSKRLRQSKGMQTFEQESVEKRILHVLVELFEEFGNTIPLTRREIAEMAGTTVETSIRTFSRLEEEGLVSTARGKIVIKDAQDLSDRIEES